MTTYSLAPYLPFGGFVKTLIQTEDTSLYAALSSQQYMGHSFDPVSRRLFFSANVLIDSVSSGTGFDKINDTGFTLYNISDDTTIAPDASYSGLYIKNYWVAYMDMDTFEVTMVDVFDPTAILPSGVHGSDGAWRFVANSNLQASDPPQFKLVDPRTADCWSHMTQPDCSIYVFREGEGYKQKLLPFVMSGHMEMVGITDKWVLVMFSSNPNGTQRNNGTMYTIPRLTTAEETANAQLLGYFQATQPGWMDTAYWRSLLMPDGSCYIFGSQRGGSLVFPEPKDYRLFRYDQPSTIGSWTGSAQPGGTFTEITPWTSSTGPNSDVAAWQYGDTQFNNPNKVVYWNLQTPISLPATNQMAWLSMLQPQNTTADDHDPANFRMDCTYYDIDATTFDYHKGFVTGYMTSAWETTTDPSAASFAVQFLRETDNYREMNAYDYGDDYTERWIAFVVQPVVGGMFTWDATGASNSTVLAKYRFVYGAAPLLLDVQFDASWLAFYTAYATAIGNDNVVEQSILMNHEFNIPGISSENYLNDTGFVDGDGIWFGGFNNQSVKIDPAMPTYRGAGGDAFAAAFVRLSWAEPPTFANSFVRSYVGNPQL